jgi:NhaP-type Na+/H+ or K+/H+ antiporter
MDAQQILMGMALVVVLGISAQWIAWRMRIPAILLLLIFGCMAGPGLEWLGRYSRHFHRLIDPDHLLGGLLLPGVSLSVAVILFEGGLTLSMAELRQAGGVILKLVSMGALATWVVTLLAGLFILRMELHLATLLGAILVVTGPTVIGPLLRHVRPIGQVGPILKWEGIVIDPIGALLAVVVFEAIPQTHFQTATAIVLSSVARTVLVGGLAGVIAASVLVLMLRRHMIPDYLQSPLALMLVVASFTGANIVQSESGLFATTIMGIALANQKFARVQHILEFKENLTVLLVSSLFILLGARLRLEDLAKLDWRILAFIAALVLIARPACVAVATIRSGLKMKERVFLAAMAPRGIVAAAVSSVFALRLQEESYSGSELLVPYTFAVIIGTVAVYGLSSPWVAKRLELANPARRGFLLAGANALARALASAIQKEGYPVILVDTNLDNLSAARLSGLPTFYGSILSQFVLDRIELGGIGRLLAITPNEEVNSLAAVHFARVFGSDEVYQLAPEKPQEGRTTKVTHHLRGRTLFAATATYRALAESVAAGGLVRKTPLTREFDWARFKQTTGAGTIPLFLVDETGQIILFTPDAPVTPRAGQAVVTLGSREGRD